MYDCIIIGAGHNGLICANYLAQKGWKVLVLERRYLVGGACVTEELIPGYKASTAAYVVSLLLPEIVEELELEKYGYKALPRNPSSFTPFEDGRYLFLGPDQEFNAKEIAKFSGADSKVFREYEAFLERVTGRKHDSRGGVRITYPFQRTGGIGASLTRVFWGGYPTRVSGRN